MKKYIALLSFVAALFVGSCSPYTDEEPGGVAVQDLCGTWIVDAYVSLNEYLGVVSLDTLTKEQMDGLDDWANWFDGTTVIRTYNTANNDKDSLWFHDLGLVGKQFKVGANYGQLTFSSDTVSSSDGAVKAIVKYGAVFKDAATTRRGQKAESIITYVKYSNKAYTFMYTGYRYTGFADDEVLE